MAKRSENNIIIQANRIEHTATDSPENCKKNFEITTRDSKQKILDLLKYFTSRNEPDRLINISTRLLSNSRNCRIYQVR